jgi:hypothetical protein
LLFAESGGMSASLPDRPTPVAAAILTYRIIERSADIHAMGTARKPVLHQHAVTTTQHE